jgi:signal transduction histidine kinase
MKLGKVEPGQAALDADADLERRVKFRTQALDAALEKNRNLLKILLHDITNPIAAMGLYLTALGEQTRPTPAILARLKMAHGAVKDIVDSVSRIYRDQLSESFMTATCLDHSYQELSIIFEQVLQRKRLSLSPHFALPATLLFRMDKTQFTHSILGNLVSNALKFSLPDSVIRITAQEQSGRLILTVEDSGIGIPPELLRQLEAQPDSVPSRPSTTGDRGMGVGLSNARSVISAYGGSLTLSSRDSANYPQHHGTCVTVVFDTLNSLTQGRTASGDPE